MTSKHKTLESNLPNVAGNGLIGRRALFIAGLGAAAVWPLAARGQRGDRMRRIGVLTSYDESDPDAKSFLSAFTQGLAELGWTDGGNLQMDIRWAAANVDRARMYAKELVELQPDVILAESTPQAAAFQRETRTIPIVFVGVSDPVGSGFVASLPRPGGNLTGVAWMEPTIGGKWLELLREIAPGIRRVAAMFNPDTASYATSYYLPSFEATARSLRLDSSVAAVRSDAEIQMVITSLGGQPKGGVVTMSDSFMVVHRAAAISAAARNNVPAIYFNAIFARDGGLLSYAADTRDSFRRAASYVDRILRGANPGDLPVVRPEKFELIINEKTVRALDLPPIADGLRLRADRIIE